MGYHGALSQGCQRCRSRKVKCDETKPKCQTCAKANLTCTGYRDLTAVVFRDESPRIVRRIEKKLAKKAKLVASQRASITSPTNSSSTSSGSNSQGLSLVHSPTETIDNVEVKFFVHNYAFHEVWRSKEYEQWILETIKGHDALSQGLRAAIGAASCAGLSNIKNAPWAAARSKALYGRALGIVNSALRADLTVVPDALLLTVIILGLHEIISFNLTKNNSGWQTHVNGAAVLLELRGVTQFKNERGVQLYFQVRNQILNLCAQHDLDVPQRLLQLENSFNTSYMHRKLVNEHIMISPSLFSGWLEFVDILHTYKARQPGVLKRVIQLDEWLGKWTEGIPEHWQYKTLAAPDAPFKLEHQYSSIWVAYAWNNWRTLRMFTTLFLAEGGDRDMKRMRVASILQYSKDILIASRFSITDCALANFRPLHAVATAFHSTPRLRELAARQLHLIAQVSGIQQARTTADHVLSLIEKKHLDEGHVIKEESVAPF